MFGVGKDVCGSSSTTALPKQGHLQQASVHHVTYSIHLCMDGEETCVIDSVTFDSTTKLHWSQIYTI